MNGTVPRYVPSINIFQQNKKEYKLFPSTGDVIVPLRDGAFSNLTYVVYVSIVRRIFERRLRLAYD